MRRAPEPSVPLIRDALVTVVQRRGGSAALVDRARSLHTNFAKVADALGIPRQQLINEFVDEIYSRGGKR